MKQLFTNIQQLIQVRDTAPEVIEGANMKELPILENAWLLLDDDIIAAYGTMDMPLPSADTTTSLKGKTVLPTWCDSHTHLVYAGNREQEFVDRINGLSYQEIAARGGGILNSAEKLQKISEEELYSESAKRLEEVMQLGTGAIEIKSGYGLTLDAELKMLRVAKKLSENYPIEIKRTFLGAHAVPKEYKTNKEGYIDLICNEMIPAVAENHLASYIDVFCEEGYFSVADTEKILHAAKPYNLISKLHVNQFTALGGIELAVKNNALSVDHLEVVTDQDIEALKNSKTIPVALPSCSYFLSIPYTPARALINAGLPLALATDYNPGSTPSGNMNFVVATACIKMRLTPEEAINAATINGAYAMGLSSSHGSITKGKKANFIVTKPIPSYSFLPYAFGSNCIESVYLNGTKL